MANFDAAWAHGHGPDQYCLGVLTAGIVLGSCWAYYELGQGGSVVLGSGIGKCVFMPWLVGCGLIHSFGGYGQARCFKDGHYYWRYLRFR